MSEVVVQFSSGKSGDGAMYARPEVLHVAEYQHWALCVSKATTMMRNTLEMYVHLKSLFEIMIAVKASRRELCCGDSTCS